MTDTTDVRGRSGQATARAGQVGGAPIRLSGLTKRYGGAPPAVDDISLEVAAGEFITLLGPSGSGKTTTLNMIAGFDKVTTGRIEVGDRDVASLPAHRRDIGMVFQHYALFPHMTAARNVAFPLEQRKIPKSEIARRVDAALRLVHLEGMGGRLPRQLSGGQQQRVAFARAIVFNPRVLLMDEPLGALDKKLREQLQGEIARIHRELGITFVFVTHDQEEALALSDRIAVFNEGRIEQVGTAEELYERPATLFVARFIGDSNVLEGRYEGTGVLVGDGFKVAVPERPDAVSGGAASLVVRPERMRLLEEDEPAPAGRNALPGTVAEVTFFGSHRRVLVDLRCGVRVNVREPAEVDKVPVPGAGVQVYWQVARGVPIPATNRSGGTHG